MFTTREIAGAIWLALVFGWALTLSQVRSGIVAVLRSVFHWKIVSVFMCLAIYTGGTVWLLRRVGIWTPDLVKDTVLWFLFAGIALAFSLVTERPERRLWRRVVTHQVKAIIFFEYLVGTYTFPLGWELLLQPFVAGIVILNTVAQTREEHAPVARILNWVQSFVGLAILVTAAVMAFGDQHGGASIRSIALAPVLSLLFIPALYLLALGTTYESLFDVVRMGPTKGWRFRCYARWRLIRELGLRPRRIARFQRRFGLRLAGLTTREELDSLLAEANAS